jgi:two-component system chemotaxis response regulator CheY
MDGLSLVRAIRELPVYRLLPILVLTTECSDSIMQRGREAGATGWMVKPFHPDQLRQTAGCALDLRARALNKHGRNPP